MLTEHILCSTVPTPHIVGSQLEIYLSKCPQRLQKYFIFLELNTNQSVSTYAH